MLRIAAAALLAALLLAAPAAGAKHRRRCHVKGADVILSNRHAVVLERTVERGTREEVWGCLRKQWRHAVLVDSASRGQNGSMVFDELDLRGTSVFTSSSGGRPGGACRTEAHVYSLSKHRPLHEWTSDDTVPDCMSVFAVAMGPRGRAAFSTVRDSDDLVVIRKLDATGAHAVDQGLDADGDSIRVKGPIGDCTLRWYNHGEARSTPVY
jgi:hypothetical protein